MDLVFEVTVAQRVGFTPTSQVACLAAGILVLETDFRFACRVKVEVQRVSHEEEVMWTIASKGNVSPQEAWQQAVVELSKENS